MKSIQVQPSSHRSKEEPTNDIQQERYMQGMEAYLQFLPSLPPFDGESDMAHTDELLNSLHTRQRLLDGPTPSSHDAASASTSMGYEFRFVTPPDQDLVCVICSLVCRDAVETTCSHLFCSSCLSRWLLQKSECATCRRSLDPSVDVHPSGFVRRKILGLEVECIHVQHQQEKHIADSSHNHTTSLCRWKGEIRYLSAHLRKDCNVQRLLHSFSTFITSRMIDTTILATDTSASNSNIPNLDHLCPSIRDSVERSFPRLVFQSLPSSTLAYLTSFQTYHTFNANETHPQFNLSQSCVLQEYHQRSASSTFGMSKSQHPLDGFMGLHYHQQCSEQCILPVIPDEDGHTDSSSPATAQVDYLYNILVQNRLQFIAFTIRLQTLLLALPVRILQSFLQSKGLDERYYRAIEKGELVKMVMDNRHQLDTNEFRQQRGLPSISNRRDKDAFGSVRANRSTQQQQSDHHRSSSASYEDPFRHFFDGTGSSGHSSSPLNIFQLHAAAAGFPSHMQSHAHAHFLHHHQALHMHATQHMLGFSGTHLNGNGSLLFAMALGPTGNGTPVHSFHPQQPSQPFDDGSYGHIPHPSASASASSSSIEHQAEHAVNQAFARAEERRRQERQQQESNHPHPSPARDIPPQSSSIEDAHHRSHSNGQPVSSSSPFSSHDQPIRPRSRHHPSASSFPSSPSSHSQASLESTPKACCSIM